MKGILNMNDNRVKSERMEGLEQERIQIRWEEEAEEIEIRGYYQGLEHMHESCSVNDEWIRGLIDEQRGLLNDLRMKKYEFLNDLSVFL